MSNRNLQALREQRDAVSTEVRNLLDTNTTDFTSAVQANVDAKLVEIDRLDSQIGTIQNALSRVAAHEEAGRAVADRTGVSVDEGTHQAQAARRAFVNALRFGAERLSDADRNLLAQFGADQTKVQNIAVGTGAAGGVAVPTIIMPELLSQLKAFGGVRQVATVMATSGGGPITWATNDDTAAEGEMVAENATASDDDMTFGTVSINAYKFSSKTIPISFEALQDMAIDTESEVLNKLAMRLARGQNRKFTTGTGSSEPMGVVTGASSGVTLPTGNTASITYDGLVDLFHALDPAYRENASFMMHDATVQVIRKLKDSTGRPLYIPSVEGALGSSAPAALLGRPVTINQHMATMAANAKSVLCGDFSKYRIRDVMDVVILRFTDSAYAKKGQIGFLAWARADGKLVDSSNASIKYLANSAT